MAHVSSLYRICGVFSLAGALACGTDDNDTMVASGDTDPVTTGGSGPQPTTGDEAGTDTTGTSDGPGTTPADPTTETSASNPTSATDPTSDSDPTTTTDPTMTSDPTNATDSTTEPVDPDDVDGDGLLNQYDNCVDVYNQDQADYDADKVGDACDEDDDDDNVPDAQDNCPLGVNEDQLDTDKDGVGDWCDDDDDDDALGDLDDNCSLIKNPDQLNSDNDTYGDLCDENDDNDALDDGDDNCPVHKNSGQEDLDGDGLGDPCDPDADADGSEKPFDPDDLDTVCPGKLAANTIYATTADSLYAVPTATLVPVKLGTINPGDYGSFVDIAIDSHGAIFALMGKGVACVNPTTAKTVELGKTPFAESSGLMISPKGALDPDLDVPVIVGSGNLVRVTWMFYMAKLTGYGVYGKDYETGSDGVVIPGLGTFVAVRHKAQPAVTVIARIDVKTSEVLEDVVALNAYTGTFSLAAAGNKLIAFGTGGEIVEIDPATKMVKLISDTNIDWRGAGSRLP